jgi:hypothetical protein
MHAYFSLQGANMLFVLVTSFWNEARNAHVLHLSGTTHRYDLGSRYHGVGSALTTVREDTRFLIHGPLHAEVWHLTSTVRVIVTSFQLSMDLCPRKMTQTWTALNATELYVSSCHSCIRHFFVVTIPPWTSWREPWAEGLLVHQPYPGYWTPVDIFDTESDKRRKNCRPAQSRFWRRKCPPNFPSSVS